MYDYHVHSTYSDGSFLGWMLGAAEDAGLDGVGVADHLIVSEGETQRRRRRREGHTLDRTYDRRRAAIRELREEVDVAVFDAAEVDYRREDETAVREFLAEADFDYAVGSVHVVDGGNIHVVDPSDPRAVVDEYVEELVAMVEAGLFEVAGHVDLPERNPALRNVMDREDYDRLARAFADSPTVPEVNAGRANTEGFFHPTPEFLAALREYDVSVTAGSDAHDPDDLRERVAMLGDRFAELDLEPVTVHD